MRTNRSCLWLVPCLAAAACDTGGGEATAGQSSEVYGATSYAGSCDEPGIEAQFDKAIKWGRVASASTAYAECVDRAFRGTVTYDGHAIGPYRQCKGDPFFGTGLDNQIARALAAMRSPNDWVIHCDGDVGLGSTNLGGYHDTDADEMWFSYQSKANYHSLDLPACTASQPPTLGDTDTDGDGYDDRGCRWAPAPWPWYADARTAWHEAAHQHGYTHGANEQPEAKIACGYAGDASWHYQVNTAPYILGECISNVLHESAATCGNLELGCYGGAMRLVTAAGSSTCECVEDPADDGFGVIGFNGHAMDDLNMVGVNDNLNGGGLVTPGSDVLRTGDFDGDGRSELVLATDNAWEIVRYHPTGKALWRLDSLAYGAATGSWTLEKSHSLLGVGDVNGDGRDDLVVKSATRLGVLFRSSTGFYGTLWVWQFGNSVGSWTFAATDKLVGVADVNGDGRDDLLIRNDTAFAVLSRGAGGIFTVLHHVHQGTWIGGWYFHGSNKLFGVADYNGDGRADFLVRSTWGLGVLQRNASGVLAPIHLWQNGTAVNSWTLADTDELTSIGDYDGDGRKDFLLANATSVAIMRLPGAPAALSVWRKMPFGTWAGSWFLHKDNTLGSALDIDGDGKDEVLVKSTWGRGLLRASTTGLTSLTLAAFGGLLGSWPLDDGDAVQATGDFDGDGDEEFVIQR